MKIHEFKKQVYEITFAKSTKALKKKYPDLVKGKDLRRKSSWISIYNALKVIDNFGQEQTEKYVEEKYQVNPLSNESNFDTLIHNIKSLGNFMEDLEQKFDHTESKFNLGNQEK